MAASEIWRAKRCGCARLEVIGQSRKFYPGGCAGGKQKPPPRRGYCLSRSTHIPVCCEAGFITPAAPPPGQVPSLRKILLLFQSKAVLSSSLDQADGAPFLSFWSTLMSTQRALPLP